MCAAASKALEIVRRRPERRRKLLEMADELRRDLCEAAFNTGDSVAQIIPVVIGSPGEALAVSRRLLESGFLLPAIRPPTVPRGTSRLRISLTAAHDGADLRRLVSLLRA